ncbi:MAG: HAMP domain-containing histidine kinase [Lachnospiraceae bacterium]|nr:HAMP domain-containing histidine kinase [Lachnospiraceae bacterium]
MTGKDDEKKERRKHGAIFWFILTVITGVITLISVVTCVYLGDYGIYDSTIRFRNNVNERLLKNYAVYALSDYDNDFRLDQLEKTNFQYGVYCTDDPTSVDLTDASSYEVCTLPDEILKADKTLLFKYSATLGEYSIFQYDINSLPGGYAYITNYSNYDNGDAVTEEHSIEKFIYAWNTDMAYLITEDGYYFPVYLSIDMSEVFAIHRGENVEMFNEDRTGWSDEIIKLCNMYILDDMGYGIDIIPTDIEVCKSEELNNYTSGTKSEFDSWIIDYIEWTVTTEKTPQDIVTGKDCYLIACVAYPLDYSKDDLFVRADPWIELICDWRYLPIVTSVIFGIIAIICFGFFMVRFLAFMRKGYRFFRYQWRENVGLLWRAIGICILCTSAEAFILAIAFNESSEGLIVAGWLVQTLVLIPLFIIAVLQLNKIAKGAARLADGKLHTPVDTRRMFYDFKKIGNGINSASVGLEKALDERMKSERFKTELISNVSHDIKTPLTSIISYVELLREQPEDEPANREYLGTLERQAIKLKKLLEDLIEASKAQTGNLKAELSPCNVNMVLHQVIGEYEERLAASELILKIHVPEEPVNIMADTKHLQRVLDNLLVNVSKYAQPGTRVYINLSGGSENAVIEIKNTSREMLNMTSDELLERFTRGDSSRGSEGNGLGLSIAQSLMELMNGRLNLVVDGDLFKVILLFPRVLDNTGEINP